jgi:hypothetical protein
MSIPPPDFFQGPGFDAVAEFRRFAQAQNMVAVHVLAELTRLHNYGRRELIPKADKRRTRVNGLYCWETRGWATYYSDEGSSSERFRIVVLLVKRTSASDRDKLETKALNRLRLLYKDFSGNV